MIQIWWFWVGSNQEHPLIRDADGDQCHITIKKRSDMNNYGHFPGLDFELVEDFTKKHLENALCIVGSTTTMLFDLSNTGLPIVLPKNNGLKILSGISLPNWINFDQNFSIEKISKLFTTYRLEKVSSTFLKEFRI